MRFTVLTLVAALAGAAVAQETTNATISAPASTTTDPDIPDFPSSSNDSSAPTTTHNTITTTSSSASSVSMTSTSSSSAPASSTRTKLMTVNLFDNFGPFGAYALNSSGSPLYVGAILDACKDRTVYAISCMAPTKSPGCSPGAPSITFTEGPSIYIASQTTTITSDKTTTTAIAVETCNLFATENTATCTQVTTRVVGGSTSTVGAGTVTYSGSNYRRFDATITTGVDKTASPTGKCGVSSGMSLRARTSAGMLGAVGLVIMLLF